MRMDSKIPRTSTKMQTWALLWVLLGQVCEGTWGVTLSAESPALPCTLTGNAAQSWHLPRPHCLWISIPSSQVTNWNPRCFTCHSIIPDLRGNMPDSADCRTEPRPYGGMTAFPAKIHQRSPLTLHYPRAVHAHPGFPCQSCGDTPGLLLWSKPAIWVYPKDRLISQQWDDNLFSRNLLQIQSTLLARE